MPDHNSFDVDSGGDVDGIDLLGFDYFMRHDPGRVIGPARAAPHSADDCRVSAFEYPNRWAPAEGQRCW
jgi:hypothetical protein